MAYVRWTDRGAGVVRVMFRRWLPGRFLAHKGRTMDGKPFAVMVDTLTRAQGGSEAGTGFVHVYDRLLGRRPVRVVLVHQDAGPCDATAADVEELRRELESQGMRLRVMQRWPRPGRTAPPDAPED